jgi:hypothetical protein
MLIVMCYVDIGTYSGFACRAQVLGNILSRLPALRLVYASDESQFQTVCPTDGKFTDLGERQRDYYMDNLLVQLDCEEAKFMFTSHYYE